MIARLRGRLVSAHPVCIVEVGGVGFEVSIPERDRETLGPADGEVQFHTYLYVREDRLVLFGFRDKLDRELFLRLMDVSGIGPKLALGALSHYPAARIVAAIKGKDTEFLRTLPGLGKKTSERIAMELADKLEDLEVAPAPSAAPAPSEVREEVLLALTSLGMSRHAADAVLEKIDWRGGSASVEEAVREALRYAGKV